jgi:hypothetical protein
VSKTQRAAPGEVSQRIELVKEWLVDDTREAIIQRIQGWWKLSERRAAWYYQQAARELGQKENAAHDTLIFRGELVEIRNKYRQMGYEGVARMAMDILEQLNGQELN